MELVYLWVKKYKNIENEGFNFSPKFECKYYKESKNLTIVDKKHIKNNTTVELDHFFPKKYYPYLAISLQIIQKDNSEKIKDKILNYDKVLNTTSLYKNHKDIVLELIQKSIIYNDSYIDELAHNYSGLFKNREDLLRLITGGYVNDEDINKRPLSKLTKDISEVLGLI